MSEDLPAEVACRVAGVSVSGFFAWRTRRASALAVRHALFAESDPRGPQHVASDLRA